MKQDNHIELKPSLSFIILCLAFILHSHAGGRHSRVQSVHQSADGGGRTVLSRVSARLPVRGRAPGRHQRHAVQTAACPRQAEEHRTGPEEERAQTG